MTQVMARSRDPRLCQGISVNEEAESTLRRAGVPDRKCGNLIMPEQETGQHFFPAPKLLQQQNSSKREICPLQDYHPGGGIFFFFLIFFLFFSLNKAWSRVTAINLGYLPNA